MMSQTFVMFGYCNNFGFYVSQLKTDLLVDILKLITSLSQSILYCSSMDENKEQSVQPTWNLVFKLELKIILISDYILGSDSTMEWKRKWWNFRRLSCCFYNKLIKHKSKHRNSY